MESTSKTESSDPTLRRPIRFSLKLLLLIFSISCVWLGYASNRARSQKRAVDRVIELGGHVGFDYQFDSNMNWRKDPKLPAPVWLIDVIGEDYARRPMVVNFDDGSDPTNGDLSVLERFTDLKQLTFMNRKRITDDGLHHLSPLAKLEVLALNGTHVRDQGLQHIRHMQNLTGLSLDRTPITHHGLKYVGELKKLEWLNLNDTQVTDEGLRHIASLPHLETLQLRGTSITDEGIKQLSRMTSLKLVLLGDAISREGQAWLQAQLPKCKVAW